jgi:hypothetical protein
MYPDAGNIVEHRSMAFQQMLVLDYTAWNLHKMQPPDYIVRHSIEAEASDYTVWILQMMEVLDYTARHDVLAKSYTVSTLPKRILVRGSKDQCNRESAATPDPVAISCLLGSLILSARPIGYVEIKHKL